MSLRNYVENKIFKRSLNLTEMKFPAINLQSQFLIRLEIRRYRPCISAIIVWLGLDIGTKIRQKSS